MGKPFQFLNIDLDTAIPYNISEDNKSDKKDAQKSAQKDTQKDAQKITHIPQVSQTDNLAKQILKIPGNTNEQLRGENQKKLVKYEREYDAYCRWIATPEQERSPKTVVMFERKWKIPRSYSASFRSRQDFKQKVISYWYEWLLDKWPTIAYSAYEQAKKGNSAHIKIFADLMAKHLDTEKPKATIQPFAIIGVPQEKINKLFMPDDVEDVIISDE